MRHPERTARRRRATVAGAAGGALLGGLYGYGLALAWAIALAARFVRAARDFGDFGMVVVMVPVAGGVLVMAAVVAVPIGAMAGAGFGGVVGLAGGEVAARCGARRLVAAVGALVVGSSVGMALAWRTLDDMPFTYLAPALAAGALCGVLIAFAAVTSKAPRWLPAWVPEWAGWDRAPADEVVSG